MRSLILALLFALTLCPGTSLAADGWRNGQMQSGGILREYRLNVPRSARASTPVVMLLHGGGGNMDRLTSPAGGAFSHWPDVAAREGAILIVPNGSSIFGNRGTGDRQMWNDWRGSSGRNDDVTYLSALARKVVADTGADPARIYVTGLSNGGMMTYRLLIEAPETFAAGAAFIAGLDRSWQSHPPISKGRPRRPILIWSGTADPLVPYTGGTVVWRRNFSLLSGADTLDWWRQYNNTATTPAPMVTLPDTSGDACRITMQDWPAKGPNSARVRSYIAHDGGHAPPSAAHAVPSALRKSRQGAHCQDVEAAEIAWRFFSAQP